MNNNQKEMSKNQHRLFVNKSTIQNCVCRSIVVSSRFKKTYSCHGLVSHAGNTNLSKYLIFGMELNLFLCGHIYPCLTITS